MIKRHSHIILRVTLVLLFSTVLFACKNGKETQEENIYTQRKQFKAVFHAANSEKMIGHLEKAVALFEECLVLEPNNHAVHFALADLYSEMGNGEKHLFHAEKAFSLNSSNKWYRLYLADLYFERGKFEKTAELYGAIMEEEKNVDLKFNYVDALIRSNAYDDAIEMLNEIEVETGKIPEITFVKYDLYQELKKPEEAQREMEEFITENPRDPEYKTLAAEFFMQRRNYPESLRLIDLILKDDPNFSQAYIMRADIALRQDDVEGAFDNLKKGFESQDVELERKLMILGGLIPYSGPGERDHEVMKNGVGDLFEIIYDPELNNMKLHDLYGKFSMLQNDYETAEEQYEKAIELDASSFDTWMQLLNANYNLEHYSKLHTNGEAAVALFPAQPVVYLLTGIGAKETGKYEEAEEWFFIGKDLVVKDPSLSSDFLFHLGHMNYLQGNADEGKFYYDQALTTYPGNVNVYEDLGKRYLDANELEKAEETLEKGLSNTQKSAQLYYLLGKVYFLQEKYADAEKTLFEAVLANDTDPKALSAYGDAIFKNGNSEKAVSFWKEAQKQGDKSDLLQRKITDKKYYAN